MRSCMPNVENWSVTFLRRPPDKESIDVHRAAWPSVKPYLACVISVTDTEGINGI